VDPQEPQGTVAVTPCPSKYHTASLAGNNVYPENKKLSNQSNLRFDLCESHLKSRTKNSGSNLAREIYVVERFIRENLL